MVTFKKEIYMKEDQVASYLTTVFSGQKSRGYVVERLIFTYDKSSIEFGPSLLELWDEMTWDELDSQFREFVEGEYVKKIEVRLEYRDKD